MYLLNAPTVIEWVLGTTSNTVLLSDLDLIFIDPEGVSTYVDAPIALADFIPPTATTEGSAKYTFTPTIEGLWKIRLVKGTALNYSVLSKVEMYVFDNTQVVNPKFYLSENTFDEKSLTQPGKLRNIKGSLRWYPAKNITINMIIPSVGEVAKGADIHIDILKNDNSILVSPLKILADNNIGIAQTPTDPQVSPQDYITVDVLQIGSLVTGSELFINFKYY